MSSSSNQIITQKDIIFDAEKALQEKLRTDKQHKEEVRSKRNNLKRGLILITIIEIAVIILVSIWTAKRWTVALGIFAVLSALAVVIAYFFVKRIDEFNFGDPEYSKLVEFYILTNGYKIDPSPYEKFGTQVHIRLMLIDNEHNVDAKHFYCTYVYKEGISRAVLDLSGDCVILYIPYFPFSAES